MLDKKSEGACVITNSIDSFGFGLGKWRCEGDNATAGYCFFDFGEYISRVVIVVLWRVFC